ncbi:MAG: enoyl-CoA hydratase/isomerase family protein [Pedobacter sp.]|nr:MAG: enoyl-CoA hydratase/isomerase family protein [Pedobacter sp.]
MNTIQITLKDRLAIVSLNRLKSNAINLEMMEDLSKCFEQLENDAKIGGVILTGQGHFFSAGLDLIALYNLSEAETEQFWIRFLNLSAQLVAFKKPLVAAINGYSPAGGCVLALACDARVMAKGNYIIGLNEVPVGIIVPPSIFDVYSFWIGKAAAARALLEGKLFNPEEALQVGLVDEIVEGDRILTQAEKMVRKYMGFEPNTWQQSKLNIRRDLIAITRSDYSADLKVMLDQWWSASTQAIVKNIIDNLQQKKN